MAHDVRQDILLLCGRRSCDLLVRILLPLEHRNVLNGKNVAELVPNGEGTDLHETVADAAFLCLGLDCMSKRHQVCGLRNVRLCVS